MKYLIMMTLLFSCLGPKKTKDMTEKERATYAMGYQFASELSKLKVNKDELKAFIEGIEDGSKKSLKKDFDLHKSIKSSQFLMEKSILESAASEKEAAALEVERIVEQDGYQATSSGLYYIIEKEGRKIKKYPKNMMVALKYKGYKLDGKIFDYTSEQKNPIFPYHGIIPAWKEAISLVGVGGKIKILANSNLAYGDRGAPPKIKGGESVIFDLEVIAIK